MTGDFIIFIFISPDITDASLRDHMTSTQHVMILSGQMIRQPDASLVRNIKSWKWMLLSLHPN